MATTISMNYEDVKGSIKARLYNAEAEIKAIKRSAEPYGFDGLVIVPVIEYGEVADDGAFASAKVTSELLEMWDVTEDEVFEVAITNLDYTITTIRDILAESFRKEGMPEELIDMMLPDDGGMPMWVVTNATKFYGASSVIPATKELITKFPEGYVALPSSVHEVIIVPKSDHDTEELNEIVRQVNSTVLEDKDYLSDDVYEFTA